MSAAFDFSTISQGTTIALLDEIERGLPIRAVDQVADRFSPRDKSFRYQFISRPTYARRKSQGPVKGRLSKAESDRVVRFARVWDMALRVWKDEDAARGFLKRAHPLLEGRTPLSVALAGEQGGRLVEDILGRLSFGSAV